MKIRLILALVLRSIGGFVFTTMGTDTVHHQFHFDDRIILGKSGRGDRAFRKTKNLSTGNTVKMGMLIGLFQASGTETPDPIICGNAVGQADIH